MKLTDIKAQVRTSGRFSIFVDGKYAFSLSDMALLEEKLRIGQELETAEIKRLKQVSSDDKLYGNALRFVAMRARSEWEIRMYLRRKDAAPALAELIVNKLSKVGLVDDAKFAEAWIANRRLLRPTSKRKLQQELRTKGVADSVVQQALQSTETDEQAALRDLIAKKRSRYPDNLKLMQYLARQGFGYDDIKRALTESEE